MSYSCQKIALIIPNNLAVIAVQDVIFIDCGSGTGANHIIIFGCEFGDTRTAKVILESRLFLDGYHFGYRIRSAAEMTENPFDLIIGCIALAADKMLEPPPHEIQRRYEQNDRKYYFHTCITDITRVSFRWEFTVIVCNYGYGKSFYYCIDLVI
jgi:hypothetical protein